MCSKETLIELRCYDLAVPVGHWHHGYLGQPPVPVHQPSSYRDVVSIPKVVARDPLDVCRPFGQYDPLRY